MFHNHIAQLAILLFYIPYFNFRKLNDPMSTLNNHHHHHMRNYSLPKNNALVSVFSSSKFSFPFISNPQLQLHLFESWTLLMKLLHSFLTVDSKTCIISEGPDSTMNSKHLLEDTGLWKRNETRDIQLLCTGKLEGECETKKKHCLKYRQHTN